MGAPLLGLPKSIYYSIPNKIPKSDCRAQKKLALLLSNFACSGTPLPHPPPPPKKYYYCYKRKSWVRSSVNLFYPHLNLLLVMSFFLAFKFFFNVTEMSGGILLETQSIGYMTYCLFSRFAMHYREIFKQLPTWMFTAHISLDDSKNRGELLLLKLNFLGD